ncbi:hypothetical protein Clacol_002776 [Clathrus columnatus]|uniref:Sodium/calcium exchanger membrane region domain-containing protein n=1 Tax=Clathrus columnatus TaxID=1419009 RepID=A0AAV5A5S2_9AGAM|nr:hypothetical protein Clacol_002776 [Clathrus columnatus]
MALSSHKVTSGIFNRRSQLDANCLPLTHPIDAQCSYVQEHCPEASTFLSLPHLRGYFCATNRLRPFVFLGLLTWLLLLFSTLGICASDFLCPNLSTIAHLLGLDDNLAGVTFLAVGNGSPDLFATFSAMRANSGSLAIGELLGAACFIVSVVVGSMCIIKPFYVHPLPFLRDVGFFTLATAVIFWILHDGILRQWEVHLLVGLYGLYVCLVITGTWWEKRQQGARIRESIVRGEFVSEQSPPFPEHYHDEDSSPINLNARPSRARAVSTPDPPRISYQVQRRSQSRSSSRSPPIDSAYDPTTTAPSLPHFSLLTALEFRDIVFSLQDEAHSSSLSLFDSSLAAGRYRTPSVMSRFSIPRTPLTTSSLDSEMALNRLDHDSGSGPPHTHIPVIELSTALADQSDVPLSHMQGFLKLFYHILVAIFATPGVLVLTITLPVVTLPRTFNDYSALNVPEGQLIEVEQENDVRQVLDIQEDIKGGRFNQWLTYVQCILGPSFCAASLLGLTIFAIGNSLADLVANISIAAFAPIMGFSACFGGPMLNILLGIGISGSVVIQETGHNYNLHFSTTLLVSPITRSMQYDYQAPAALYYLPDEKPEQTSAFKTRVLGFIDDAHSKAFNFACVPLTTSAWRERWMQLRRNATKKTAPDVELWRQNPCFQLNEVNVTRLGGCIA